MKRRLYTGLVAGAMTVSLLSACGGSGGDDGSTTLTLGSAAAPTNAMTPAADQFKEAVESGTDGRVKVTLQLNGVVGDEFTMSESIQRGTLDMGIISDFGLSGVEPAVSVAGLPYLFTDMDEVKEHYYNGFLGKYNTEQLAKHDIRVLAWGDNSFRALSNSVRPVQNAADIDGLNLRVTQVPVLIDYFEALGARVTPLPITETLTSLQQGLVDGQENGVNLTASFGFGDAQEYMTITNHAYSAVGFVINEQVFEELSEADRQVVQEAATEAAAFEVEQNIKDVETNRQKLEDGGIEFSELTPEAAAELREQAKQVWAGAADEFDPVIMEQIQTTLGAQ
ncbi:MAG: dicarboxylate transporter subunit DctP [Mycobacterium sp.]|jgi:tripartite ATP-independent transporter DctP family solute receptor|nr:dicarboxylate transporter subunit DctP [Mycobacterium sp.]